MVMDVGGAMNRVGDTVRVVKRGPKDQFRVNMAAGRLN
jgi:hypothetical protein